MDDNLNRVFWQCRRSMLELDLLLQQFARDQFNTLSNESRAQFLQLLTEADQDLFTWLVSGVGVALEPPPEKYKEIIQLIKNTNAKTKF